MNLVLLLIFGMHSLVFAGLSLRRKDATPLILALAFLLLSVLYTFRLIGFAADAATLWVWILRTVSLSCSITYLILMWRRPGTWPHRLIGTFRRR